MAFLSHKPNSFVYKFYSNVREGWLLYIDSQLWALQKEVRSEQL